MSVFVYVSVSVCMNVSVCVCLCQMILILRSIQVYVPTGSFDHSGDSLEEQALRAQLVQRRVTVNAPFNLT